MSIPTPHNSASLGDIAKTVLMPGDPLRAKFIADNYLSDAVLFTGVRNVYGYTGKYNGKTVSVMASGMGIPSIGIYSYELFNFYGVENIIRVGTAGAISPDLPMLSLVLAAGACTNSNYAAHFKLNGTFAPIADFGLLSRAYSTAQRLGIEVFVGNIFSNDAFYSESDVSDWQRMNVLAVEMEAAGLYMNAARAKKKALCICAVSDHLCTGEQTTSVQRERGLDNLIRLGLETAE